MKKQTIMLDHGTLKVETKAYVFGEWAAHPVMSYRIGASGWRISHAPTGIGTWNLCDELDRGDAIRIARELSNRVPSLSLTKCKPRCSGAAPVKMPDEREIIVATFAEVLGQ